MIMMQIEDQFVTASQAAQVLGAKHVSRLSGCDEATIDWCFYSTFIWNVKHLAYPCCLLVPSDVRLALTAS